MFTRALAVTLVCAPLFAQLEIVSAPSKPEYTAGEPVFMTAKVTNTGSTPVKVAIGDLDSCLSSISVTIEGAKRSDLAPCVDPERMGCSYNGPLSQLVEIKPHSSQEIRRVLSYIYDLTKPGVYQAHVHVQVFRAGGSPFKASDVAAEDDRYVSFTVVERDSAAMEAAFAPTLADINSHDPERAWKAEHVLMALAPSFAEARLLAWAENPVLGPADMAALRKLGTPTALEKLKAIAFEAPDGNREREMFLRQAALQEIKYLDDRSLLPKLLAITAQDRGQMIRWHAANAAARIGHSDAVPAIAKMLATPDEFISFAGAEAMGETASRDAVPALIAAIPGSRGNTPFAAQESLRRLTHRTATAPTDHLMAVYQEWSAWWAVHRSDAPIYGPDECGAITPLD